jgi:hypothetical protein
MTRFIHDYLSASQVFHIESYWNGFVFFADKMSNDLYLFYTFQLIEMQKIYIRN